MMESARTVPHPGMIKFSAVALGMDEGDVRAAISPSKPTISAGDTLFVLSEGLAVSGKSLREGLELHGHAQAIHLMGVWLRARHAIHIEHLHKLHHAIQTGAVIDCLAFVGEWKIEANGTMAITTAGKTCWYEYAPAQYTSALIKNWLRVLNVKLTYRKGDGIFVRAL